MKNLHQIANEFITTTTVFGGTSGKPNYSNKGVGDPCDNDPVVLPNGKLNKNYKRKKCKKKKKNEIKFPNADRQYRPY